MKNLRYKPGLPKRNESESNPGLHFSLRPMRGILDLLTSMLQGTREKLVPLDEMRHDEPVSEETLKRLSSILGDQVKPRLEEAVRHCENALQQYKDAHSVVEQLFVGESKDASEEFLARAVRAAEERIERMRRFQQDFELPNKPHAIRKLLLTALQFSCSESVNEFKAIVHEHLKATPRFVATLEECTAKLEHVVAVVLHLRNHPSNRVDNLLNKCIEDVDAVRQRLVSLGDDVRMTLGMR